MHTREKGLPARPRVQFMTSQQSKPKFRVKERRLTLATGMPPPNEESLSYHGQEKGILSRRASVIIEEHNEMEETIIEQEVRLVFAKPLTRGARGNRFPWCWPGRM